MMPTDIDPFAPHDGTAPAKKTTAKRKPRKPAAKKAAPAKKTTAAPKKAAPAEPANTTAAKKD